MVVNVRFKKSFTVWNHNFSDIQNSCGCALVISLIFSIWFLQFGYSNDFERWQLRKFIKVLTVKYEQIRSICIIYVKNSTHSMYAAYVCGSCVFFFCIKIIIPSSLLTCSLKSAGILPTPSNECVINFAEMHCHCHCHSGCALHSVCRNNINISQIISIKIYNWTKSYEQKLFGEQKKK